MKAQKGDYKKSAILCLFIFGIIAFSSFQVCAMELNESQKEVWKMVEATWDSFLKGDFEAIKASALERSLKWWPDLWYPRKKNFWPGIYYEKTAFNKTVSFELKPVAIEIVRDAATVFYYYKWKGEKKSDYVKGREFSTYIKQDGKWRLFGSINCSCDIIPDCPDEFY